LLVKEKAATRARDAVNAERRRLPMIKIDENYVFEGANGKLSLLDLFDGRRQLIVYHFMFDPAWEEGCPGCTGFVDALGDLTMLSDRDTSFVLASRAPLAKLEAYKAKRGWARRWVSSFGTDFNYDFHVTQDEKVAPILYNYRDKAERKLLRARGNARPERLLPRWRRRVSHLLDVRPRLRRAHRRVQPSRHHAIRPSGGLGRLARGMAAKTHVRVTCVRDIQPNLTSFRKGEPS